MSAISSPVSSGAEPPHSPAGSSQHDCSPLQLTPRSKVRALLAAIDGDSDPESASKPQSALQNALTTEKAQRDAKDSNQNQNGHGASVLTIPRGKIAARLQRQQSQRQKQISSGDDHAESAYERVKMKEDLDKQRRDGDGNMQPQLPFESDDEDDVVGFSNRRLEERGTRRPGTESIPSSPSVNHRPSPALFLSSSSSQPSRPPFSRAQGNGSDSDRPSDPKANQRFLALVARKKKEREEKAAAEKLRQQEWHQQQAKVAKRSGQRANVSSSSEDEADAEGAQKLTQQARPTRKASKKALEEMSRETQRMSRNMQLAHQAKTRRKITKESLFARFNFQANTSTNVTSNQMNISSTAASSVPGSDSEIRDVHESPPTSPLGPDEMTVNIPQPSPLAAKVSSKDLEAQFEPSEENLPDIVESVAQCSTRLDKGKGRATDDKPQTLGERKEKPGPKTQVSGQRQIKLRLPEPANKARSTHSSDSDLEIVPERKKMKASKIGAFERLTGAKATEGHSLQTLRALANLSSPSKNDPRSKPSMALSDMQTLLQSRARQQAAQERAEKIQELKSKGIIIQTAEEREKDQMEIEDLLEKARREAEELKQKEKEAAKIEAKATGAALDEGSSEEDEDYQANDADESDIELSGSDEERIVANASDGESEEDVEDEKEEEGGIGLAERSEGLIDNEASDTSDDETKIRDSGTEGDEASMDELTARAPRARKRILVIDDDEEEGEVENEMDDSPKLQSQLGLANEFLNPLPIIPGLPLSDGASLGLTQAFAATMADTRNHEATEHRREGQRQHSPIFPSPPPEPDIPMFHMQDSLTMEDSEQVVLDSQNPPHLENQEGTQPNLSQAPSLPQDSIVSEQMPVATQMSDMPDPTQDVGFANSSPIANRFVSAPPSTQDTLIITQAVVPESPIVKKKGRLRRGKEPAVDGRRIMEVEPQNASANAFDILKMASKKPRHEMENFNKKNSKAQEMVEEQAQESEDEYAGLGGASDEDSGEEPDEEVKKMIEEGDINVDERELAAFYADKERASDSAAVSKLFKDISSGLLRRKRGVGDFDLSDSDDDIEARRRRKRREFAKMRKALLENENVGKIAEDPKKLAFLRAIEDREGDEDLDFLEQQQPEEPESQVDMVADSQENANKEAEVQGPTTMTTKDPNKILGKRKRPLGESLPPGNAANMRPPPAARRTHVPRKPATLAEIRASVSFLIEEPDAAPAQPPSSSPPHSDHEGDENGNYGRNDPKNPFQSRRTSSNPIIDRLSLKRESSSTVSAGTAGSSDARMAFAADAASSHVPEFKVPSLIRRATSSMSGAFGSMNGEDANGISTLAVTERAAGGGEKDVLVVKKKGGRGRSSINWCAREKEKVEKGVEQSRRRERERERIKAAKGLGSLGGWGAWE